MKNRLYVLKIIGFLCFAYSLTLVPPMLVAYWHNDGELGDFFGTSLFLLCLGFVLWFPFKNLTGQLHRTDGFLIVAIFWILFSSISTIPFITGWHLDFVDALFEATSGFTTTGATVIKDLEQLPPSLLYYRQQLQFFGGMGLVVLAIAIVPILGVGGTQLYRAETPGPMKDEKLAPRLAHTARSLCLIYVALTGLCALGFWVSGMSAFSALQHSFATVATGGFSIHNESIGYYQNYTVNFVAVIFMLLGAINFGVHYLAIVNRKPLQYVIDTESRSFLLLVLAFIFIFAVSLSLMDHYHTFYESLNISLFTVTSVITSTGFGVTDFSLWPAFLPVLMIFISFIGGCGGSTAGGIKVMRVLTVFKVGSQQTHFLIHPKAQLPVRIGERIIDTRTIQSMWGFFAVYTSTFAALTLLMMMAGLDQVSAFSAVAATLNNLGPGLGQVSWTFADVSDGAKLLGTFSMLLGRLEIFTLLVILTPEFWRR